VTARERRALMGGAVVLAAALATRLGAAAVGKGRQALHQATETAALTSRARALVAEGPVRQSLLRERANWIVSLAPALLSGASAAEAGAALAGELNALAARHRLTVARFDPIPDTTRGMVTAIRVRFQAESDLSGIYGFIHEVETGPLLLSFTDLTLSTQDSDSRMERLQLEATVKGWMTRRAETPKGAVPPGEAEQGGAR